MYGDINEILNKELDQLVVELISEYDNLGMRASGKWADSLEVKVFEKKGVIFGEDYSDQLEHGRKPGKFPPIDLIKKWVVQKGLTYDISLNSLVFLIARKISRKGWKREGYGGVELISKVITEDKVNEIMNSISNGMNVELIKILEETYKQTV